MSNTAYPSPPSLELAPGGFANRTAIDAARYFAATEVASITYQDHESGTTFEIHRSAVETSRVEELPALMASTIRHAYGSREVIR